MQPSKHGFIGAYTCDGYVVFDPEKMLGGGPVRRVIVRGGSSRSRAAAMSAISRRLTDRGYEADALHGILEADTIEGVVCPSLSLIVTSGGDSAVCDDQGVKCVDLDDALRTVRSSVYGEVTRALSEEIASYERRVVRYMKAASPLLADAEDIYGHTLRRDAVDRMLEPWIESISSHRERLGGGVEARFFAEAVTPGGVKQHLDSVMMPRMWRLSGPWGSDFHEPLTMIRNAAIDHGINVICAMEHMRPDRVAHLLMPELGLFVTSEVNVHALSGASQRTIDLRMAMPSAEGFSQHTLRALAYDELMVEQLMDKAAYALDLARQTKRRMDRMIEERVDEQAMAIMVSEALTALEPAFTETPRLTVYA